MKIVRKQFPRSARRKPPERRWSFRLIMAIRIVVLLVCAAAVFSGHYPPLEAQSAPPNPTTYDVFQDGRASGVDTRVGNLEVRVSKQWDIVNAIKENNAHTAGVMETIGSVLVLLIGGSITIQIRSKKGA